MRPTRRVRVDGSAARPLLPPETRVSHGPAHGPAEFIALEDHLSVEAGIRELMEALYPHREAIAAQRDTFLPPDLRKQIPASRR